ncbi:MAG: response regulator [Bdellovibrionales bacterium]|nr:response regulator [Bdellovibrionales bacterium]
MANSPRVYILDDRPENLEVMAVVFQAAGATTFTTSDPLQLIQGVLHPDGDPIDLVILDIHMPHRDGFSVAQELREKGFSRGIVAFTAHPTLQGKRKGEGVGIDHFLSKPSLKVDLVRALLHEVCACK